MTATDDLLDHTLLARHVTTIGERDRLYQRARRHEITRVLKGCYVETAFWSALKPDARHRAQAQLAALAFGADLVFSHLTAVALWHLPMLGAWPTRVNVSGEPGSGVRATATLRRHTLGIDPAITEIDGLRVTSLAVTVAQVAAAERFANGVVVADAALRRSIHPVLGLPSSVTAADLLEAASMISASHGGVRSRSVVEFADGRADRPGESMSRVSMHAAGLTMPQLQVVLFGASGTRYVVDFYWPTLRLIGEFDGKAKYEDPTFLRGRTPAQALADEKFREDDLRAAGYSFRRWGWEVALSAPRLAAHLRQAGVR